MFADRAAAAVSPAHRRSTAAAAVTNAVVCVVELTVWRRLARGVAGETPGAGLR